MKRAIAILFILLPTLAFAETVHETRRLELPAGGISKLEITCGAGAAELTSEAGLKAIRVTARIEVEHLQPSALPAFISKNVRLKLEKRGKAAFLLSDVGTPSAQKSEARIHLWVTVPDHLDVKITDASGPLRIENLKGNLEIRDDSGKVEIESVAGNVKLADGSGSILIEDVAGFVTVRDGSGSIEIYDVEADVEVNDGSGYIKIRNIGGNVTVVDGSGDIDIKEVLGNVYIKQAGTGDVDVDLVKGKITIRD